MQIARVVEAVRKAVPAQLPVSAKMRLGFNDRALMTECAQAMESGGACEIVVHARTKLDGYRPPAYWEEIPRIREAVGVNVVANGEIWTVEEALRCREVSGCDDLMLGRGIVADPGLALAVRRAVEQGSGTAAAGIDWLELVPQVQRFWHMVCEDLEPRQRAGRLKQWLNLMRRRFPEAEQAYQEVRTQTDQRAISDWVQALPLRDLQQEWAWPQSVSKADCPEPEARAAAA
jgi:tRNA-dihydrouridine synthase C